MTTGSTLVDEPPLAIPRSPRFWGSPFGWSFSAAACVAAVGAVLLVSSHVREPVVPVVTVKGIMASKQDFFNDAEVRRLLLRHHIRVEVTTRGSHEVAQEVIGQETEQYDFTFPSGQPAADLIKNHRARTGGHQRTTRLFSSPIVLASYREYAETLARRGIATPHDARAGEPLYYTLDTAAFVKLGEEGRTWNDIAIGEYETEDGTPMANGNRVLAHSPGVCRSNSAVTYLGLVAFVKNGERPPRTEDEVDVLARQLQPLVTAAGMPESELFRAYVTPEGRSQGPVVVVYEHQYLAYQLGHTARKGKPDGERVLLYPRQEFQTDPELISLTPDGDRLAELLATDRPLRKRMMELGYRVVDDTDEVGTGQLFRYLGERGLPAPAGRADLTSAAFPELDLLERLIRTAGRCRP